jgi:HAMP domain-containing protein
MTLWVLLGGALAAALSAAAAQSRVTDDAHSSVSDSTLTFPAQTIGTSSAAQSVVLTNEGPAPLSISRDSLSGSDARAFQKTSDDCQGATLAAGGTCAIAYTFVPVARGVASATLTVFSMSGQSLPTFALSGTGVEPVVPAPPSLSALTLSASSFRPARSGASAINASEPTGAFVIYTDSQAAVTDFLVERRVRSHYRKLGGFTHTDAAGTNALRFTGRIAGHTLAAGNYRLSASAHSAGGVSPMRSVTFQITG